MHELVLSCLDALASLTKPYISISQPSTSRQVKLFSSGNDVASRVHAITQALREDSAEPLNIAPRITVVREGDAAMEARFFWHMVEDRSSFSGGTYNYQEFMEMVNRPPGAGAPPGPGMGAPPPSGGMHGGPPARPQGPPGGHAPPAPRGHGMAPGQPGHGMPPPPAVLPLQDHRDLPFMEGCPHPQVDRYPPPPRQGLCHTHKAHHMEGK